MSGWRPLKRFCTGPPQYGLNTPAEAYVEEGLRFLRTTDVTSDGGLTPVDSAVFLDPKDVGPTHELRPDDLLFSRSGTLGRCLRYEAAHGPATFAGYLVRFRPNADTSARYVAYCSQARFFQEAIGADAVSSTIANFNADRYASLSLPWWPRARQRVIADFLDSETARIDALIAKKRRLVQLIGDRQQAAAQEILRPDRTVHLRHVADLLAGYTFPSESFAASFEGPLLLRGINVGIGEIRWDEAVRLATDGRTLSRYRLAAGDVVVGMDRPFIGKGTRVAEIDSQSVGSLLVQRVCRIRASGPAESTVIRHVLASSAFLAHVEPDLTGVSVPHLSEAQIGSTPMPSAITTHAAQMAENLRRLEMRTHHVLTPLHRQLALLVEHRQALITEAVTGELEIPGVAA